MPRYYIECHEDGEFLPTFYTTIEADDAERAKGLAMVEMRVERGSIEEPETEEEITAAINQVEDFCYVDVCVELPEDFEGNPATALEDLVDEHAERDLRRAFDVQTAVRQQREMATGGLY